MDMREQQSQSSGQPATGVSRAPELLEALDAVVWEADAESRLFTFVSRGAEAILGHGVQRWLSESDFGAGLVYVEDREAALAAYREASESGELQECELRFVAADGRLIWLRNSVSPSVGRDGRVEGLRGVMIDVSELKWAQGRLRIQYAVTRTLADAETLDEASSAIIQAICDTLGWSFGALWLPDEGAGLLRHTGSWHSPAVEITTFLEASRNRTFTPGVGLPGRVWQNGRPAWVRDVTKDDNFPRAAAAVAEGLHGACAFPIVLRERVLGVVEFFSHSVREPEPEVLALMAAVGSQIGQFIERRGAEQAQHESELRAAAIVEAALDCVISIDAEGRLVEFNPAAERTFGYRREEILGQKMYELIIPEELREAHKKGFAHYLATGEGSILGQRLQLPALRADGSIFPAELAIVRVSEADPPVFTGYLRDLTEHKEVVDALRLRNQAMEATAQGILITDHSQPGHPIIYANPAFARITGYTEQEVVGRNPRFLQGAETDPVTTAAIRDAIASGLPYVGEILNYRKDGSPFWSQVAISPIHKDGEITHFVGVQSDISERKNLEDQLRQAQKMEAVGRLAGGIAHDFNNILLVVKGHSDFLVKQLSEDHPLRPSANEIGRAAGRASALTSQLLAFSRRQVLQPKEIDLSDIVAAIGPMLERLIGEDIELAASLAPDLGHVMADRSQIDQVIMNLVVNARDAMPAGGRLVIETANVTLDGDEPRTWLELPSGAFVMLAVSDNGLGMDAATKERIFEPFFTTKRPGEGTGLGLATVYGIVRQTGGSIWVYSEPGEGTSFKIYFPRLAQASHLEPVGEVVEGEEPRGTETVLLVEDDEQARTLVHIMLEIQGYTVLAASNGGEALAVAEAHEGPIDLLVSDVVMPGMGGRELAKEAAARRPSIRVLFTSGYTGDSVTDHGIERDAAFLPKPFDLGGLSRKIREVLDTDMGSSSRTSL
jgi:two-component system, cell cycle sensor histidine kinase and response regulator CckA